MTTSLEPRQLGDPVGEQRRLAAGDAVLAAPTLDVVRITGADHQRFLDALLSRDLGRLAPGESSEALLLDAAGHVQFAVGAVADAEGVWLLPDHGEADRVVDWVHRMRFMMQVEAQAATDAFVQIGWFTADRPWQAELAQLSAFVWRDPWAEVASGGWQYAVHPTVDYAAWRWNVAFVPDSHADQARALLDAAAVTRSGADAWQALRVAAGRPRTADEVDERSIPHELDWLRSAVHLNKGCYPGQETVAKVHNLGHPPRRLVLLQLDGGDTWVEHGDAVLQDGHEVGLVTTAGLHYEMGPIALAVIKRVVPVDATLQVRHEDETVAAVQEVIVPPEAGALAADAVGEFRRARRQGR